MQLVTGQRLAIDSHRENRFPLDAFWEMGIYWGAKTAGFAAWAKIQFSHRWVNWESIRTAWESILIRRQVSGLGWSAKASRHAQPAEAANPQLAVRSAFARLVRTSMQSHFYLSSRGVGWCFTASLFGTNYCFSNSENLHPCAQQESVQCATDYQAITSSSFAQLVFWMLVE
ncbi:hypothetical protein Pan181_04310 [Aeoliella mucimassa]|uniref:Uncharacterized protein n=1 Tax=Aeoliella mucimassa TaxID=2527972 RepID=A0A518AHP0_9BACT|nr:hypothetical protein Pan181_04310 [Aeoliella mucimassa]